VYVVRLFLFLFLFIVSNLVVAQSNESWYLDFGANDLVHGKETVYSDENKIYWNNITHEEHNAAFQVLFNSENVKTKVRIKIFHNFSTSIEQFGEPSPDPNFLGELAVKNATQDYFLGLGSMESKFVLYGLNPQKIYDLDIFGSRNSIDSCLTNYKISGSFTHTSSILTSGENIGGEGIHYNRNRIVSSHGIQPASDSTLQITVYIENLINLNGVINLLKITEVGITEVLPLKRSPLCEYVNRQNIVLMGSTTSEASYGETYKSFGEQYNRLLQTGKYGGNWNYRNLSQYGRSSSDILSTWDTELAPWCPSVVIYALSMGDEDIHTDEIASFQNFKNNLTELINLAKYEGFSPIVVNSLPRNDIYNTNYYQNVKNLNLDISKMNIHSVNGFGAVEDGVERWAYGFNLGAFKPNDYGHIEIFHSIEPYAANFARINTPQPKRLDIGQGFIFDKSESNQQIEFHPNNFVHSFSYIFDIKTKDFGILGGFLGIGIERNFGQIKIDSYGKLWYQSSTGKSIETDITINDGSFHQVALVHQYANEKSVLFLDGKKVGELNERLFAYHFFINGPNGPNAEYKDLFFYRSAMNELEINELFKGEMLYSSLEIYAPLFSQTVFNHVLSLNSTFNVYDAYPIITGIEPNIKNKEKEFKFYPNPAKNFINIENPDRKSITISLHNINGSLIFLKNSETNSSKVHLSLTGLKKGLYFLSIKYDQNTITEKLVIN